MKLNHFHPQGYQHQIINLLAVHLPQKNCAIQVYVDVYFAIELLISVKIIFLGTTE